MIKKGPLFVSGEGNSVANPHWNAPAYSRAEGFHLAAQALMEKVKEDNSHQADLLFYPIFFLYRHHLELLLKEAIPLTSAVVAAQTNDEFHASRLDSKHDLYELWLMLEAILKKIAPEPVLDITAHYLREFAKYDSNSQAARYAVDKHGKGFFANVERVDLSVFAERMESVSDELSSLQYWLEDQLESYHEMQVMYEHEMETMYQDVLESPF